jgi:CDP-paratose 2-epimerase
MKLLITGGCGFLGSNLAAHALERGDDLIIFDNLSRYGSSVNLDWLRGIGKFDFIHGDIRSSCDVDRLIKSIKPETVFHLAGQVAMTTSISNPRLDFETNVLGSLNLLESVRAFAPDAAVLYSSTNKVYGDLEQYRYEETEMRYKCIDYPQGFAEHLPLDFRSPYGCSKGAADQYFLDYARIYGLKTVVFRHSSMYGGRQFATFDQGWIGWFCQQAMAVEKNPEREPFTISGNGKQVRDLLYASDCVALYFNATYNVESVKGQAFNIGGGFENSSSLLELFDFLERELNIKMQYRMILPRDSDQRVFIADIFKAQKMINWQPQIDKAQGLRKMIEWIFINAA